MLQAGKLSEGHGKALLAANGNDVRRRLARDAFNGGWSVRETEKRVRLASQPRARPRRAPVSPDEQAAIADASDALESAIGYEVKLRQRGTALIAELHFDDLEQAHGLARDLRHRDT